MRFIIPLLALFLAMPTQAAELRDERELVIGISQYPGTLNPLLDSSVAQNYILSFVRRPLTAYDKDWNLVCMLCEELPTLENGLAERVTYDDGTEGIAVTVEIKPDAEWADGTPITTNDVRFTWQVGQHPQTGVVGYESFKRIRDIKVTDNKVFTLYLDRVSYSYNQLSGFDLLPAHVERVAFEKPDQYRFESRYDRNALDPGLYNGPYKIVGVNPGSHITLEPNPSWNGQQPYFDKITIRAIANTAALQTALLSDEIDMIAGEAGIGFDEAASFAQAHAAEFKIVYKPSLLYEHIDLNLDQPMFNDVRVRQALLYSVDREAINTFGFDGRQTVADTFINPLDKVHTTAIRRYSHDPEKAKKLLDEAGWTLKDDGFRYNAAGERLRFPFVTTAGNRTRELIQQVLQNHWKQIGIDVFIDNEPARVLFGRTLNQRRFKGAAMYAWSSAPESLPLTTLHSDYIPNAGNGYAGQNYTGFKSEKLDTLIETLEKELDAAKRQQLWTELQQFYAENLPALPLFFRASIFIMPGWLEGLEPTGHQFASSLWAEEWYRESRF